MYIMVFLQIQLLTKDDVWLNETWVRRAFTEDQLSKLPLKNVLSKAIGSKEEVDFPVQEVQLQDGDVILMCSDGLHGLVNDQQILATVLQHQPDLQRICSSLISHANEAGGKDNITVVAVRYSK